MKTISSLKQATLKYLKDYVGTAMKMYMITHYKIHLVRKRFVYYLCAVGIVMINANRSSMNVLNALYIKARQGR